MTTANKTFVLGFILEFYRASHRCKLKVVHRGLMLNFSRPTYRAVSAPQRAGGGEQRLAVADFVNVRSASSYFPGSRMGRFSFRLPPGAAAGQSIVMFSHIVVFWTDPAQPNAVDELIAGANKLESVPGVLHLHVGKMVGSARPIVDQSYQVALNLVFTDKRAEADYQTHPLHVEFVEKIVKRVCKKVVIYDFE
jgi:hypothetical protein